MHARLHGCLPAHALLRSAATERAVRVRTHAYPNGKRTSGDGRERIGAVPIGVFGADVGDETGLDAGLVQRN